MCRWWGQQKYTVYRVLVRAKTTGRPSHEWDAEVKMDLTEVG
jgi:hypothetical protein